MKKILLKYKYAIGLFLLIIIIIAFIFLKISLTKSKEISNNINAQNTLEENSPQEEKETQLEAKTYYVDIKGAVTKSGVYEVTDNTRVIDVVNLAGGLSTNANTSYINLAKKVTDEMVIIIYTNEEIANAISSNQVLKTDIDNSKELSIKNDACITPSSNESTTKEESDNKQTSGKVNINTADVEELTTISGIGESKAKAIIAYREENGNFKKIEDILNVSGIGEKLFEKIKENITV